MFWILIDIENNNIESKCISATFEENVKFQNLVFFAVFVSFIVQSFLYGDIYLVFLIFIFSKFGHSFAENDATC
jgi:hypothetical protein